MRQAQGKRLLALDIMRGITIAGMILVNNPGSWQYVYAPLRHADWHGLTPTDLVYPFFMFIMGASMYFSLRKYREMPKKKGIAKILRRGISIFLVGISLHWFSMFCSGISQALRGGLPEGLSIWEALFSLENFRILGVLQRLGLVYILGGLLFLYTKSMRHMMWIAGSLLVLYVIILHCGNGYVLSGDNIISRVDCIVLGASHLYQHSLPGGGIIPFELEGIISTIPSVSHVLLGVFLGKIIVDNKESSSRLNHIFLFGTIILFAGLLLQYLDPINKKLWTSSYTLVSCGIGSLLLALLIWIIDVKNKNRWCTFFNAFGVNPLIMYVAGWVLSDLLKTITISSKSLKNIMYQDLLRPIWGDYGGSLAYGLIIVGLVWLGGFTLYKKGIYIKL